MKAVIIAIMLFSASSVSAQYRNYEVQPNGTGGYRGTYGNQNFDTGIQNDDAGHIGGRRPGVVTERRSMRRGSIGATQKNCVVDGNGFAFCR